MLLVLKSQNAIGQAEKAVSAKLRLISALTLLGTWPDQALKRSSFKLHLPRRGRPHVKYNQILQLKPFTVSVPK